MKISLPYLLALLELVVEGPAERAAAHLELVRRHVRDLEQLGLQYPEPEEPETRKLQFTSRSMDAMRKTHSMSSMLMCMW